ncbi:F-box family protein [Rhynchospora pubera]|uniref:F-box family protein n=1 Tax=Rhynchospora pubera TaxID=906938 RepID=A0AAV8EEL7_9POAL|nr:F-box family protein [Rhynchospora pubera]
MYMANWSDLPDDMLEYLTSFLPIQDCHRFSAVCQNWHIAAKQKRYSPAQQIPWLALGETDDKKKRKFYDLLEDRHYYLDAPGLRGKVFCGSSYGWLFTLDRKLNFHLLNPLTGEFYDLPPPPPFYEGHLDMYEHDLPRYLEAESDDEEAHGDLREIFEGLQRDFVLKAILDYDPSTRSDFTAVILYGKDNTPAFWRPGDDAWTAVTALPTGLNDIIFFKGMFYTVQSPIKDNYSAIYTFKVGNDPNPKATKINLRVPCHGDHNYVIDETYVNFQVDYLVIFDAKLHLVERFIQWSDNDRRRLTTKFVVHKLDLEGSNYSTCDHINGHAIFLGGNSPVVIGPSQFHKCMEDAIYFTDFVSIDSELYGAEDNGIFDMIRNNTTPYYPHDVFHHTHAAPIWFTPNQWSDEYRSGAVNQQLDTKRNRYHSYTGRRDRDT